MGKKIEDLDVEIDELALSLVGWQVEDVRARLVTESYDDTHFQEIAVSGTARFLREDWADRFSGDEDDDYPPTLLLGLSPADRPELVGYTHALLETVKKAAKRPVRFSRSGDSWECAEPVRPGDIKLQVTSFDLSETDLDLTWPAAKIRPLPAELLDETTCESVRLRLTTCDATLVGKKRDATLQVRLAGFAEFGTAKDLLTDLAATETWRDAPEDEDAVADECPFDVPLPGVVVEVLDATDFLLDKRDVSLYGRIPVGEGPTLPSRPARWVVQVPFHQDDLSGQPARVVVRVLDAEDL